MHKSLRESPGPINTALIEGVVLISSPWPYMHHFLSSKSIIHQRARNKMRVCYPTSKLRENVVLRLKLKAEAACAWPTNRIPRQHNMIKPKCLISSPFSPFLSPSACGRTKNGWPFLGRQRRCRSRASRRSSLSLRRVLKGREECQIRHHPSARRADQPRGRSQGRPGADRGSRWRKIADDAIVSGSYRRDLC